jgi:small-conductance mechanosensitive channel
MTGDELKGLLDVQDLLNRALLMLPQVLAGLVVFLVLWGVGVGLKRMLRRFFARRSFNRDVEELVEQGVEITFLVIGVVVGLDTMGVDVGALVASLGLIGFAVGFALKDAISNFLAGVMLLLHHPFERRDCIKVADHEGTVLDIDFRYTILENEAQRILVPNSKLFSNVVVVDKAPAAAGEDAGDD